MNDADHITNETPEDIPASTPTPTTGQSTLKPKGTCWYCNAPVDNIRRFCNKECADDYRTEEENFQQT